MRTKMVSFEDAPVLTVLFDSPAALTTQREDEQKSLASADTVLGWIRKKVEELAGQAGGQGLQWVSSQLLRAIGLGGGGGELDEIRWTLERIEQTQREVLTRLESTMREIQFQHLITRGFEAVERITSRQERLSGLVEIPAAERAGEAQRLQQSILDPNSGVLIDLKIIHDVLVGNSRLDTESKGVLELFMEKWKAIYVSRQTLPDVPLSLFEGRSYEYLHGLFLIQYMGLDQLANARVANGEHSLLKRELEQAARNLDQQRQKVEAWIPAWTRTWLKTVSDLTWYIIKPLNMRGHTREQVLYGSPGGSGYYLDYTVQFRDRHTKNGDEEWQFQLTGTTDTFWLRERSRPNFMYGEARQDVLLKMGPFTPGQTLAFRFVMSANGKPALAAVNSPKPGYAYLAWASQGNNVCFLVPDLAQAVEIDVIRQPH